MRGLVSGLGKDEETGVQHGEKMTTNPGLAECLGLVLAVIPLFDVRCN